jgi:hypothetical protein
MCLSMNIIETDKLREEIRAGRTTFYKVYASEYCADDSKKAFSPYRCEVVVPDANGFVVSDRESISLSVWEAENNSVSQGIHCYSDGDWASDRAGAGNFVIPVVVSADDFVATNEGATETVFTRVKLDVEELKRLVGSTEPISYGDDDDDDDYDDWDDDDDF